MTDKELLELAAHAVAFDHDGFTDEFGGIYGCFNSSTDCHAWNPLNDDGDAFRLAVKLGIDIKFYATHVEAWKYPHDGMENDFGEERTASSTRRAIVRAAAEIGKSIQYTTYKGEV